MLSFEEGGKESGCVSSSPLHIRKISQGLMRSYEEKFDAGAYKCQRLQVRGSVHHLFCDSRVTASQIPPPGCRSFSCLPFHPSLLRYHPLNTAWILSPPKYCMEVNIFLLQEVRYLQKQFLEVCVVSLYEEIQDLVQNVKPSVGTNLTLSANTSPASHQITQGGNVMPHNQLAVHEDVSLITIAECQQH